MIKIQIIILHIECILLIMLLKICIIKFNNIYIILYFILPTLYYLLYIIDFYFTLFILEYVVMDRYQYLLLNCTYSITFNSYFRYCYWAFHAVPGIVIRNR